MITTVGLVNTLMHLFVALNDEDLSYTECFALGWNIWEEHELEERGQLHS